MYIHRNNVIESGDEALLTPVFARLSVIFGNRMRISHLTGLNFMSERSDEYTQIVFYR